MGRGIHLGEARTLVDLAARSKLDRGGHGSPLGAKAPRGCSHTYPGHYELGCLYSYRGYSYYYRFSPIFTRLFLQDYYSTRIFLQEWDFLGRIFYYYYSYRFFGLSWENILVIVEFYSHDYLFTWLHAFFSDDVLRRN